MLFATTGMEFEHNMLSEIKERQLLYDIRGILKSQTCQNSKMVVTTRVRKGAQTVKSMKLTMGSK